ncbi:MAG: hypothetical protein HQ495_07600 [Alphaproteobacteria bacterium]|nr:hypothetical protein [Alphaproteobacteria bacterium]
MRVDRLFSSTSLGGQGPGVYDTHSSATGLPEAARRLRQKGDARFRAIVAGENVVAGARADAAKADSAFNNSILGAIDVGGAFIEAGRDVARTLRENEAQAQREIALVEAENGFDANVVEIPSLMAALGASGEREHVAGLQQAHAHALGQVRDENDRALLAPRLDRKLAAAVGEATKASHQRTMRDARNIIDKAINGRGAQAAAPGEVSEHLNTVQEIYGLIDNGRRAGVFGAGEAERRKAAARTTYGSQFARAAMARDPQAFLAGLDDGRFTALLGKDPGALTRWRDEGGRVVDQRESAAKLEDLSAYAADYGDVRAQVDSGVLSVAGLKEMDWLRKSDIDWLTKRVEEKDTEARRQQEALADMDLMRDGKVPADSERRRQAEEAMFALGIKGDLEKPTDATPQVIADTARRYDGRVPDFVTDQIVETFAGGAPEYQVLAAKAMIELGIVGEGVTSRVALSDAARAYLLAGAAKAGRSPADAVAHAAQALAPDAATKAARQEALDAGHHDKNNQRWLAQQGTGDGLIARRKAARQGRPGAADAPLEVAALQDGFKKYFARAFVMTGDAGAARTLAANLAADDVLEALSDGGTVVGGEEADVLQGNLSDPTAPISSDEMFEDIGGAEGLRG